MKPLARRLTGCILCLLLAACSSAPTRFYTLVPQDGATQAKPAGAVPYRFELLPVTIPAGVDQPELVIRQNDDRVALLEGERWIAPLGDQIHSTVSDQLQARLGSSDVSGLAGAGGAPVYRIKLNVRRFESVPGRYALITAGWSVRGPDGSPALACTSTLRETVDAPGYGALVRGHQQALESLSADIATAVRQLAQQGKAACPAH